VSAATTGAPQALIASMAASAGARGAPENPVPKIASMTTPDPASASVRSSGGTSRTGPSKRSRFAVASDDSSAAGHSNSTSAS
jgi:hypothetical protein